jgi:hypothetical protein
VLLHHLISSTNDVADAHVGLLAPPMAYFRVIPNATVTFDVGNTQPDGTVPITVTATQTALFITLTTQAPGRFSENVFCAFGTGSSRTISFVPFGNRVDLNLLTTTTRIEHAAMYMIK